MNDQKNAGMKSRRRPYLLALLALATIVQLIRIASVQSSTGEMPFLSANDRSRWCTILALTVNGNYVIDDILEIRDEKTNRRTWYSIDIVQHRGSDGKQHYYSSKPPLLSTIYAGVYWCFRGLTGATLVGQPFFVVPWMLILVNLVPLVGMWWLLARWADQKMLDDGQVLLLAIFAMFGTFLSTFVITLNNHLPAAVATALSLACLQRIILSKDHRTIWYVICGLATSFTAANELPALSWMVLVGTLLFLSNRMKTLLIYLPSTVLILVAFFGTNYAAHGTFRPAYSMRDLGKLIVEIDLHATGQTSMRVDPPASHQVPWEEELQIDALSAALRDKGFEIGPEPVLRKARREGVWELWDPSSERRFGLKPTADLQRMGIYHWGDWYDFPTSYWKEDRKQGVDRGEPSRLKYAIHCLIGHHGILSLTPFWWISFLGFAALAYRGIMKNGFHDGEFLIAAAIAITSLIVLTFYLMRPLEDRNYGGVTSGLRWMFWFVPLWYWLAIHGMSPLRSRWHLALASLLVAISLFSATYPWNNPWTATWLSLWIPL